MNKNDILILTLGANIVTSSCTTEPSVHMPENIVILNEGAEYETSGISLDGKELFLNDSVDKAEETMGTYDNYGSEPTCYYFLNGYILIETDSLGIIRSIEVRRPEDHEYQLMFNGFDLFTTTKKDLFTFLAEEGIETEEKEDCMYDLKAYGMMLGYGFTEEEAEEFIRDTMEECTDDEIIQDNIEEANIRSTYPDWVHIQ